MLKTKFFLVRHNLYIRNSLFIQSVAHTSASVVTDATFEPGPAIWIVILSNIRRTKRRAVDYWGSDDAGIHALRYFRITRPAIHRHNNDCRSKPLR